jgi:heme/copper-type cytochrome/quinol oxidase subunit 2
LARTRQLAVASVALAATALLAGCGGPKTDHLKADDGPLQPSGNGITPTKLAAHKGHKVQIVVTNTAKDKEHGFSIDAFDIHRVIKPRQPQHVTFTPKKTGEFRIYCQLHPAHQPAQLVVVG